MTMTKHLMIVVGLVLAAPRLAAADEVRNPMELGAFAGYHVFSEDNELGAFDEDALGSNLGNAPGFGVRIAWLHCRLAIEGELFLMPAEAEAVEEPAVATEADDNLMVFGWRAQALFHVLDGRYRPFVLGGIGGLSTTSSDSGGILSDTDAMFHAGVGLKAHIRAHWGLRADVRAYFPPTTDGEFVTTDWEVLLGVYGTFTGPKPPPPAPAPEPAK
jgi:hypothetical protein